MDRGRNGETTRVRDQGLGTMLWRGKWYIAASFAVAVALALLLTSGADRVYQGSSILQVTSATTPGNEADPLRSQEASVGLAQTYATLLGDRSFLDQIRPQVAGGNLTTSELRRKINASAIEETGLIRLLAKGDSHQEAAALSGDVARGFVSYVQSLAGERSERQQEELQARISSLGEQIEGLRGRAGDPAVAEQLEALRTARAALAGQVANIVANGIQEGGSVQLSAPPTASSTPISPRPLLNLVTAILLGLMIGVGLAWLRDRLDRGLHSSEEAEELLGVPVLAAIPERRRFSADDPVLGEAYDVLRANLAFIALDRRLQVLTLSSYNPGEGKSSSVEGLAYAAVRGGMDVAVVDGDVRRRKLSTRLGYDDAPGLTNVVIGMASLPEVAIEVAPGLTLVPSGPTPPNPSSLLATGRMRELLDDLRERHSLILIDSPPVANLADASILASFSDGVVLVARVGVTQRANLEAAVANLRHSPTPIVGSILLEPRTIDQTYYPAITKGAPTVPDAAARS